MVDHIQFWFIKSFGIKFLILVGKGPKIFAQTKVTNVFPTSNNDICGRRNDIVTKIILRERNCTQQYFKGPTRGQILFYSLFLI